MEINDKNFEIDILKSKIPVLIEFWASWCVPCKMMDYILNELKEEYNGRILIAKLNVDRNRITSSKYNLTGIPTFMIFKDGKSINSKIGAQSKDNLVKMISKVLK
ncbi:MAG: thioredoxin [Promethearchaeota archaeon]